MRKNRVVQLGGACLMAAALLAASCGGDDSPVATVTQNCMTKLQPSGFTLCQEATAAKEVVAQVFAQCSSKGGTLSDGSCSSTDSVGKCTVSSPQGSSTQVLYKPATTSDAQTFCGQVGGTYSS